MRSARPAVEEQNTKGPSNRGVAGKGQAKKKPSLESKKKKIPISHMGGGGGTNSVDRGLVGKGSGGGKGGGLAWFGLEGKDKREGGLGTRI